MLVRPAVATDIESIKACAVAAYTKYIERMGQIPAPMVSDFNSLISSHHVSVACDSELVRGFVVFYRVDQSMHLENVAVFPEYAGSGIGRLLIDHVESIAVKAALDCVTLYTNEAMTENLLMYPKLGFSEYERRVESGFKRVYFRKILVS